MTTRVIDIMKMMEAWAPPAWAESWDKVGLHIGSPDQAVTAVATALTITDSVIEQAKADGADMIVAHHPLIWEPIRALRRDIPPIRRCLDLAASGIACYIAHTNLDVAPGGVNETLAKRLGLTAVKPLFPAEARQMKLITFVPATHVDMLREALAEAGAGKIGDYDQCSFEIAGTGTFLPSEDTAPYSGEKNRLNKEPEIRIEMLLPKHRTGAVIKALFAAHPYEEVAYDLMALENTDPRVGLGCVGEFPEPISREKFIKLVQTALPVDAMRIISSDTSRPIRQVAVLGGSGGGYVSKVPFGIDAFITGDVNYHQALDAQEKRMLVIDAGHHATETPIIYTIAERIQAAFPDIKAFPCADKPPFTIIPVSPKD